MFRNENKELLRIFGLHIPYNAQMVQELFPVAANC